MNKHNTNPYLKSASAESRANNRTIVLITLSITLFFTSYMYSSVNVALPSIGIELGATVIEQNWITSAIFIATAVFLIPFGRLADIFGLKKIMAIGYISYVAANLVSALSTSVIMLIVMRLVQGIAAAMIVGNAIAMASVLFPPGERGRAIGITSSAVYVGLASSPLISGFLTSHLGWRSIFMICVPAGLILLFLLLWQVKGDWRESKGEGLDLIGTTIFGFSVIALMYGFSQLPKTVGWVLIPIGIVLMIGFIFWENRAKSPLIRIDLFKRNKVFIFSNISALINYAATYSIIFFLSLYLQYVKGLSAETAGLILATQPFIQATLSAVMGRLSDKIEPRILSSLGMAITGLSLSFFIFLSSETSVLSIIFVLIILGTGFAMFVPPNTNAVMSSVDSKFFGVTSAVVNTMRNFGQMLSMGIAMIVLALVMGSVAVSPENYLEFITSTRISFVIFAGLCFIGIFTSLCRGNVRKGS
jgi:MFS family permease